MEIKKTFLVLFVCVFIISACSPVGSMATPTASSTATLLSPTETPKPTNTTQPTRTPMPPTATIAPPDMLVQYLESPRITFVDSRNRGPKGDIPRSNKGYVELVGKDWDGFQYSEFDFNTNQGMLVNFMFTYGSEFEMYFDNGQFYTDGYKRFGTYIRQAYVQTNRWDGKLLTANNMKGNFYLQPDTWYSLLMTIGENGDFFAIVWDPQDPTQFIWNRQQIEDWKGITWKLAFGANNGTIQWDQFSIVEFDGLKPTK